MRFVQAYDGVEALDVAHDFEPDIVLLDLGMPKMDGYEAARTMRLASWGKTATLIALTGWGQPQDRKQTSDVGFDAHLIKPVSESRGSSRLLASAGRQEPSGNVAKRPRR